MAANTDYYQILGVSKSSTHDEIKKAYRKLALEYHPDRNKSKEAEQKFKEVTKAYEVLSNDEKRRMYDQVGHAAFEQGAGQGPFGGGQGGQYGPFSYSYSTGGSGFGGFDFGGYSDPFEIFEQFFGGGSPFGNRQRRPVYSTRISFMDAVHGAEKEVTVEGKKQKIKIPAGVDSGSRIRFEKYDILIDVIPDKRFMREGADVITEHELSYAQAALGDEVNVTTIDGDVKIRIPEGTQPGTLIRLNGRGIPYLRGSGRGSHYVRVKVVVPKRLTGRQKELLEELRKEERGEGESKRGGWF
jgi:DnaJ-class molecular chaperone